MTKNNRTPADYRKGGQGCIDWIEDKCYLPVTAVGSDISQWTSVGKFPEEYYYLWSEQCKILLEALVMKNEKFVHRLIVLCWQRGEGKSLLACLIQLWKFFNWPRQQIVLGANSKEQTKFVHYDIMRDIILNSPQLLNVIGLRNVQEKDIRLKDSKGRIVSQIRALSTATGIVSNITGYTFSEMFNMKKPKFYVELAGYKKHSKRSGCD